MQKLYCYIDETGQDARSKIFLVSVVIAEDGRDDLVKELIEIEKKSGKGNVKWIGAKDSIRLAYIRTVLNHPLFKGKLYYAVYSKNPEDYFTKTVLTIARAIVAYVVTDNYRATVLIDGLPKSLISQAGVALRKLRVKVFKVRGVRKEETDALMRLADAICGFVRAALEGREEYRKLLERAKDESVIREI